MKFLAVVTIGTAVVAQGLAQVPASLQRALAGGPAEYVGYRTVTFNRPNGMKSHVEIVTHRNDKSRVEFPKATPLFGQIIVEDSQTRQQLFPKRREIEVAAPRNELAAGRLRTFVQKVLKGRWRVGSDSGGSVAGITTDMVWFEDPKGIIRQRLWIDPQNGMILEREVYDV